MDTQKTIKAFTSATKNVTYYTIVDSKVWLYHSAAMIKPEYCREQDAIDAKIERKDHPKVAQLVAANPQKTFTWSFIPEWIFGLKAKSCAVVNHRETFCVGGKGRFMGIDLRLLAPLLAVAKQADKKGFSGINVKQEGDETIAVIKLPRVGELRIMPCRNGI